MTTSTTQHSDDELLTLALRSARDTRCLQVGAGARHRLPELFGELFNDSSSIVIADDNTFPVAGRDIRVALTASGRTCCEPLVLSSVGLYAEYSYVDRLQQAIATANAVPIAVGSGAINDLTKLAAHRCGRQYLSVATAASMDGYTAFGASITHEGSKQTFDCPAPLGVVADLEVIAAAPDGLNASGYADLVAKCPAGADWILADGLGIDPIDRENWEMVQSRLQYWMADPDAIRQRDLEALRRLTTALMITGFAMQAACSSRPVSGAEHQFSHLWDMEHHTHNGTTPSHGFKVGIGSLASLSLYEALLDTDIEGLDVERAVRAWPDREAVKDEIAELFPAADLRRKAILESGEKYLERNALRQQLELLISRWPTIRDRLSQQLISSLEVRRMLAAAGCPTRPEDIGISRERLRISFRKSAPHPPAIYNLGRCLAREPLGSRPRPSLFFKRIVRMSAADELAPIATPTPVNAVLAGEKTGEEATKVSYWQRRILISTIIGYALYYFVRKNLTVAMPAMEAEGISKSQLGIFLTAHGLLYGVSKFANGIIGDRVNARWFMPIGLAYCGVINVVFGMSTSIVAFGLLWAMNGWFQGIGYPPCARLMTHWFPPHQLATKMGIWNISHSLGAGVVVVLCGYLVVHDWRLCFFVPAAIALVGAPLLALALRDTPESLGLPPISGTEAAPAAAEPIASSLRRLVFANPYIWVLSLANFFVYSVRYGILDWGPSFLKQARGIDLTHATWLVAAFEVSGLLGMLFGGWITDRVFAGRPARACFFYMILCSVSLLLFWWLPNQWWLTSAVLLCMAGFFVYGPQSLIGTAAANLATKRAAAAAVGLTGLFGYLSAVVTGVGIGALVDQHGWDAGFLVFLISGLAGTLLFACCWKAKAHGYHDQI